MSYCSVTILGRLGHDPELKYTPSGVATCALSLATSESWPDKNGQRQQKTEWHRVVVWGRLAELCAQHLTKGRQALVVGRLQTRSWEKDGEKRYATEIVAQVVQFIGSSSEAQSSENGTSEQETFNADNIPF